MLNVYLLTSYSILLVLQARCFYLQANVFFDTHEFSLIKHFQIVSGLISILPLLLSEILAIYVLSLNDVNFSYVATIRHFDFWSIFSFLCIYVTLSGVKMASLLRGINKRFHYYLHLVNIFKCGIGEALALTGFAVVSKSYGANIPFVVEIFCLLYCVTTAVVVISARIQIGRIKIGAQVGGIATNNNISEINKVFIEINGAAIGGTILYLSVAFSLTVLIPLFRGDREEKKEFISDLIIDIPWRVGLAIGATILPSAHLKAKKLTKSGDEKRQRKSSSYVDSNQQVRRSSVVNAIGQVAKPSAANLRRNLDPSSAEPRVVNAKSTAAANNMDKPETVSPNANSDTIENSHPIHIPGAAPDFSVILDPKYSSMNADLLA